VNSLLEKRGINAQVEEITVASFEEAAVLRFPGSPTVRVNGRDVDPPVEKQEDYGLG
jgi:hypothetical protein